MKITSPILKAMRSAAGWSQEDLAEKSKVGYVTIRRIEQKGNHHVSAKIYNALLFAFQQNGITFKEEDGFGVIRFDLKAEK